MLVLWHISIFMSDYIILPISQDTPNIVWENIDYEMYQDC